MTIALEVDWLRRADLLRAAGWFDHGADVFSDPVTDTRYMLSSAYAVHQQREDDKIQPVSKVDPELAEAGSPCSLYTDFTLRIEEYSVSCRGWTQRGMYRESEIDRALDLVRAFRPNQWQTDCRLIRIRFERIIDTGVAHGVTSIIVPD